MRAQRREEPGARHLRSRPAAGAALFGLILLSSAILSYGQSGLPRRAWGFTVSGLFPEGEFNRRVGKDAIGLSAFGAWRIGRSPLLYGFELAGHIYGYKLLSSTPETFNSIVQCFALLRLQPRTGAVVTYFEALAGINYLSAETDYSGYLDECSTVVEFEDATGAAGVGAGLCMQLGRGARTMDPDGNPTYLEFKVRYVFGGHADYMREAGDGSLVPEHSATNIVTVQLGLTWFF